MNGKAGQASRYYPTEVEPLELPPVPDARRDLGWVNGADLLGPHEVAELLGLERSTLTYHRKRDFPAPLVTLKIGPVWSRADVKAWQARRESR